MRLLLAVDSRPSNQAAIGILDPLTASWEHFEIAEIAEPFKRRGFRGALLVDDLLYVLSSAALYLYRVNTTAGQVRYDLERTVRRPEWEIGARAAADLHHLHFSKDRGKLFVANSYMDAIDELTPEGDFVKHHYLWDISPAVAEAALERNPAATDLVHCNHITEHNGRIYLTCGNWNGTRTGKVICFDTGEVVLDGLNFPHDGFVHDGDFYISATGNSEVLIYDNVGDMQMTGRSPDHVLPVTIQQPTWENSFQWVRGIHVTEKHIVCGVTQWRNETSKQPQIPPRLAFFDRQTKAYQGELFLPSVEGFPSPSLFTLIPLPDDRADDFDFQLWQDRVPLPEVSQPATLTLHSEHAEVAPPHFIAAPKQYPDVWPGTWTPYTDPGIEEQASERIVGIVMPPIASTGRLATGWSYVDPESNRVKPLPDGPEITVSEQVVFYTGTGYRNSAPKSGSLAGEHFLQLKFHGQADENAKLGCDLYCWHGKNKRPEIQELGQVQLTEQSVEHGLWAYVSESAERFRLVFRMYQPTPVAIANVELSLFATIPEKDRLGSAETAHTEAGESPLFAHLNLLPRWLGNA